ncbi:MAG: [LysW]-aminoadipate kinase [Candidatus Lokiarchaeota archaeon]|nr:[LysW]-aminoadipate kinase [Candidatus Lokiarchaeota archaeon]
MVLIIIKIGGKLISESENLNNVFNDILTLKESKKIILVHGGGPQINQVLNQMGKKIVMLKSASGFKSRFTDKETAEIATMVMAGSLNKFLVSKLQKIGIKAVGISGVDASIVKAKRKDKLIVIDEETGKKKIVRGDYSGKIEKIDINLINLLLNNDFLPVISSIALSEDFEPLNVDGDRMALYLGSTLKADELFLLTDVKGLLIDEKIIKEIGKTEIDQFINLAKGGMKKKLFAAKEALNLGLKEVIICSGIGDNPIINAINRETGTSISWKYI